MDLPIRYEADDFIIQKHYEEDEIFISVISKKEGDEQTIKLYRMMDEEVALNLWSLLCDLVDFEPHEIETFFIEDNLQFEMLTDVEIILE